ncbi:MAG TPA: membrane dipeptidase [Candidatus Eisenbacteria bacterium]
MSEAATDWTKVVDNIERVPRVGGRGAAGIGSDYDGIEDPPRGLEDVSKVPVITEELLRRGHTEEEVRGVLGENFPRFWERVEAAKKTMAPRTEPLPLLKPNATANALVVISQHVVPSEPPVGPASPRGHAAASVVTSRSWPPGFRPRRSLRDQRPRVSKTRVMRAYRSRPRPRGSPPGRPAGLAF